jgi:hypothetical protein
MQIHSSACCAKSPSRKEFSNPGQGGRVNFYLGDKVPGQAIDAATPPQARLFTNGINAYDMTILTCQGADSDQSANQAALRNYAAAGGRVFATHRSFNWLYNNDANAAVPTDATADNWSQVAQWRNDDASQDYSDATFPVSGILDFTHNPKANAFQGWLSAVGALNAGNPAFRHGVRAAPRHGCDIGGSGSNAAVVVSKRHWTLQRQHHCELRE